MEIKLDTNAHASPSANPPRVQWIGVEWMGGHYAVPLSDIGSVFRAAHAEQMAEKNLLDVEVHAGAAVFLRPLSSCFDIPPADPLHSRAEEERRWVVVLRSEGLSQIGCRVHNVVGPFWVNPQAVRATHAGRDWLLVRKGRMTHA